MSPILLTSLRQRIVRFLEVPDPRQRHQEVSPGKTDQPLHASFFLSLPGSAVPGPIRVMTPKRHEPFLLPALLAPQDPFHRLGEVVVDQFPEDGLPPGSSGTTASWRPQP